MKCCGWNESSERRYALQQGRGERSRTIKEERGWTWRDTVEGIYREAVGGVERGGGGVMRGCIAIDDRPG